MIWRSLFFSIVWLPFWLVWLPGTWAQISCLPDGFTFTNQEEIDRFKREYPECREIIGPVTIFESQKGDIKNVNGFSGISVFQSKVEIHGNDQLNNLAGFSGVSHFKDGLNIYYNRSLETLTGLENVDSISGSLRISNHPALVTLKALSSLQYLRYDLSISNNGKIENLRGLQKLPSIGGYLIISENNNLKNLIGLDGIQSIGRSVLIQNNPALLELSGLQNLHTIGLHLIVEDNDKLGSMQGVNALEKIVGNLLIVNNDELFDINALLKLTSIDGLLQVYNNPELISLSGLDNIDPNGIEDLALIESGRLFECQVRSICEYLKDDLHQFSIGMNAEGCSSREEILNQCNREGQDRQESNRLEKFIFFPNPTRQLLQIRGPGSSSGTIRIMNSVHHVLREIKLEEPVIDLGNLPNGMYIVEIKTETRMARQKIVKM